MTHRRMLRGVPALSQAPSRDSRANLQAVIDALPDATIVVDVDYTVVHANRVARELGGWKNPLGAGVKCFQIFHDRELPCGGKCPLRKVLATKAPVTLMHTHPDAAGRAVRLEITAAPIFDDAGAVSHVVESCHDVTRRERLNRLLEIANEHMEMRPLLKDLVVEIKELTDCDAVGIGVFNELSGKHYAAASCRQCTPETSESDRYFENAFSLYRRLSNDAYRDIVPLFTKGGSFGLDGATRVLPARCSHEQRLIRETFPKCGCETCVLVPIRGNGSLSGIIHVADARPSAVADQQIAELETIAAELATTLRRVCAEESLRAARDELEVRVQQRTAQLAAANQSLQDQIRQRARLEREILRTSEIEQQRIGREIHDGLGQELTGLGFSAQTLHQKLRAKSSSESQHAAQLAKGITAALREMHMIVRGLISAEIDGENLFSAFEHLLVSVEEKTGVSCRLHGRSPQVEDSDTAVQLYRITQEAVANAVKHGQPRNIEVTVFQNGDQLELQVRDDGSGCQLTPGESTGYGLQIMRHRARVMGGELEFRSKVGSGTVVTCRVPR